MASPQQRNPLALTPAEVAESRKKFAEFQAKVLAQMEHLFADALIVFGEDEGRQKWRKVANKPRGRAKGTTRPAEERNLLKLYDGLVGAGYDTKGLQRRISEFVKAEPLPHLSDTSNVTAKAIERRLRRALKRREEQRAILAAGNPLLAWYSKDK